MKSSLSALILTLPLIALTACETTQQKNISAIDKPSQQAISKSQSLVMGEEINSQSTKTNQEETVNSENIAEDKTDSDSFLAESSTSKPEDNFFQSSYLNLAIAETDENYQAENFSEEVETNTLALPPLPQSSSVLFGFDRSELTPEDNLTLLPHVEYLIANPIAELKIEGHTDATGPAEYNLYLSEKRAMAVKAEMVALGANESQLSIESHGEDKPVATANAKRDHRRVELSYSDATQQLAAASEVQMTSSVDESATNIETMEHADATVDPNIIATGVSVENDATDSNQSQN